MEKNSRDKSNRTTGVNLEGSEQNKGEIARKHGKFLEINIERTSISPLGGIPRKNKWKNV